MTAVTVLAVYRPKPGQSEALDHLVTDIRDAVAAATRTAPGDGVSLPAAR